MFKLRDLRAPLAAKHVKMRELIRQELGDAEPINWSAAATSYRAVPRARRHEALSFDPWAGDPALGMAFVEEGRELLKTSIEEARSFALLARHVAGIVLAPCQDHRDPVWIEIGYDLVASSATLLAEISLLEKNVEAAELWLAEAEHHLRAGTGDPYPAAALLQIKALAAWSSGAVRRALACLRLAARISASVEDHCSAALACYRQGMLQRELRHERRAARAFHEVLRLLPKIEPEEGQRFLALLREAGIEVDSGGG